MARYSCAVAMLLLGGAVGVAAAQTELPLVGLSAEKDRYVAEVSAPQDAEFTIHACAFGGEGGEVLEEPLTVIRWVVHQACCGAALEVLDVAWNPDLQHEGHPLGGVISTLDGCRTEEAIWLATLRVRLRAPGPGAYLWAAGPFGWTEDCEGAQVRFRDMPLRMIVPGDTSWGALHAEFRD